MAQESESLIRAPPKWVPDDSSSTCKLCKSQFGYILQRKHHCRACGELVCGSCSGYQSKLPQYGLDKVERVCTRCRDLQGPIEVAFHRANDLAQKISENQRLRTAFDENDKEVLVSGTTIKLPGHKKERKLFLDSSIKAIVLREDKSLLKSLTETRVKFSSINSIVFKEPKEIIINKKDDSESLVLQKEDAKEAWFWSRGLQNALDYYNSRKKDNLLSQELQETRRQFETLLTAQSNIDAPKPTAQAETKPVSSSSPKDKKGEESNRTSSINTTSSEPKTLREKILTGNFKSSKNIQISEPSNKEIGKTLAVLQENTEKMEIVKDKTSDMAKKSSTFMELCRQLNEKA